MENIECRSLFEHTFPFWDKLSAVQQEHLCSQTKCSRYLRGRNIHGGSGECTGGIVVKSGCLRVYLLSEEGKEVTLYRLYPQEICMLSASCVLEAITFDVFVDAQEDSECYIFSGKAFADITKENIYAENFALNMALSRFSDVMWVMQQILFMSLDKRFAIFLYGEMDKTGDTHIHMTQEDIANHMGSAREVISRMLKYFAAEGIAKSVRGGVKILDKERLKALAEQ